MGEGWREVEGVRGWWSTLGGGGVSWGDDERN